MKLGYIGLGLMGIPCTLNLLKAGHTVHVWARRPESAKEVLEHGAIWCDSKAEVAAKSEIVFLNVTNTQDVEAVLFEPSGIVESKNKGLVVVDMSTISATATRKMGKRMEEHGMVLVDAPVSGGTAGAKDGTLTIMVGATQEIFDRIKPVLADMGKTITRMGDTGAGQVAKSCNQIVITGAVASVAEAFRFAKTAGVDPALVREALLGGLAASKVLEVHGNRMVQDTFVPGFKAVLHTKDMSIVSEIAKELGLEMPVSQVGYGLLQKTVDAGFGEEDSAVMFRITK